MEKDMFYNYPGNPGYDSVMTAPVAPSGVVIAKGNAVSPLINAGGDQLGARAKANSEFDLYFRLYGEADGGIESVAKDAKFSFDVMDSGGNVVSNAVAADGKTPLLDADGNETRMFEPELLASGIEVKVRIRASDSDPVGHGLRFGVYRMRLSMEYGGKTYSLFSENDGILSIE